MIVSPRIPPGQFRNGTLKQSAGRWYDMNLVRFYEGAIFPVGGWAQRSADTVTGAARTVITWVSDSISRWIGIGTHSHLQAMNRAGDLYDITPVGLTTGHADAEVGGGYGSGAFGSGVYGTPRIGTGLITPATVWSLDTWGQYLVGCNADDGVIYEWDLDTGTPAEAVTNAPVDCRALIVTEDGFLVALAAGGVPRKVQWCDQRNNTDWTPSTTNQAGDFDLQTMGQLMCGRRTRGAHLLFTDLDVHRATYIGPPYIFGHERIAEGCGIISQAAAISAGDAVFWMSARGFWVYNGVVQPLACEVWDHVFGDLNLLQKSKIWAEHNAQFGEVKWSYPSGSATEIDRYVTFNYRNNTWSTGREVRTCGVEAGVFEYPIRIDAEGAVFEHENGPVPEGYTAFVESGPMQLGTGENVITVLGLLPDEDTEGDVEATFYGRMYANGPETTFGPYDLTEKNARGQVCTRFTTRHVRVRFSGARLAEWRLGPFDLDVVQRGRR